MAEELVFIIKLLSRPHLKVYLSRFFWKTRLHPSLSFSTAETFIQPPSPPGSTCSSILYGTPSETPLLACSPTPVTSITPTSSRTSTGSRSHGEAHQSRLCFQCTVLMFWWSVSSKASLCTEKTEVKYVGKYIFGRKLVKTNVTEQTQWVTQQQWRGLEVKE